MACQVNLFDVLQNESSGGVIVFDFFSFTQDATPDSGGTTIDVPSNGIVDFTGAVEGYYYFTHTVGEGDCEVSVQFWVLVLNRPNAGIGQTINLCEDDEPINIFSLLMGSPSIPGSTWSGSGTLQPGYIEGDPADPSDDMFDPSLQAVGVYEFILTTSLVAPAGYTISNCPNCADAQATITINVVECGDPVECNQGISNAIQVCRTAGCIFNLIDQLDGTPSTTGGGWTQLPGSPQVIVITGGATGTVNFTNALAGTYQFEYAQVGCTGTSLVTVQVVNPPNAGNDNPITLCDSAGATSLFGLITGSPTSGGVFTINPVLPVGTFNANGIINPAVGDAGTYTVTYTVTTPTNENPCGTTCQDVSTHVLTIQANCNAGANGGQTICTTGSITLNAITLLGASTNTGTWYIFGQSPTCNNVYQAANFSVNGGAVQNYQGAYLPGGSVLSNFQSVGCIAMIFSCGDTQCFDSATFMLTVITCSGGCTAGVTISAVNCVMSSLITGTCPSPIYQWQQFVSGSWIDISGATSSGYTGVNGGTYRLKLTNCTNCGTLYSNQLTLSCPPPPSCNITCSVIYDPVDGRLEATINNSGGSGGSMNYQFNKYITNDANCALCSGVMVAQCSGTVVVPAGGSVTVNCVVAQTASEQCWRFVVTGTACNNTLCCTKIPAAPISNSYYIAEMPQATEIIGVTVNIGGSNVVWNKANFPAQFNCNDYESRNPPGLITSTTNCSLAQLVNDINQRLTALGDTGNAYVIQSNKSSSIRISLTGIIFVNVLRTTDGGTPIPFTTTADVGCDGCSWHFQEFESTGNFNVTLDASAGGTFNLYTQMLQMYMPEIVNTGTFTKATGELTPISVCAGCMTINTTCLASVGSTITITNGGANHGLLTWSSFVPLVSPCSFSLVYHFQMPDTGCNECIHIRVNFVT